MLGGPTKNRIGKLYLFVNLLGSKYKIVEVEVFASIVP
jgi:hypothetical protein